MAVQAKGARRTRPFSKAKKMGCSFEHHLKLRKNYRFFAAFFFAPLAAFFAIEDSSLHWWIAGSASRRRTLPPGTSARRCGDLASWADPCA